MRYLEGTSARAVRWFVARRVVRARRRKEWSSMLGLYDVALDATGVTQYGSGGLGFLSGGLTVMRVIGSLTLQFNQVDDAVAAGDACSVAVGLTVVSSDQFAAGVGGLPDPLSEPEYPWLLWKQFTLSTQQAETAGMFLAQGPAFWRWEFDSRVRRKMAPGETLVWVAQYADIAGGALAHYSMDQNRVLLALP